MSNEIDNISARVDKLLSQEGTPLSMRLTAQMLLTFPSLAESLTNEQRSKLSKINLEKAGL